MLNGKRILTVLAVLSAAPAAAGDVTVVFGHLRSAEGVVQVALCPRESFTQPQCPYRASVQAGAGRVAISGVPDGDYAAQAVHDEDADGELDRRGFRPSEGIGFSRDAPMRRGPPCFEDAAIRVQGNTRMTVNMRYFQ